MHKSSRLLVHVFFKSENVHIYILYVDGTDADVHQHLLTSDAEVQTVNTPQDTKDYSLKCKLFSLLLLLI